MNWLSCFSEFRRSHWVWRPNTFVPSGWIKQRESLWYIRSNWRWLLTFTLQPNNPRLSTANVADRWIWGSAMEDVWLRDTCAAQAEKSCFSPQQQAIEDLQCEEEKVNLLTKEKTKLQLQAEDVSSYSLVFLILYNMSYSIFNWNVVSRSVLSGWYLISLHF